MTVSDSAPNFIDKILVKLKQIQSTLLCLHKEMVAFWRDIRTLIKNYTSFTCMEHELFGWC